MTRTSTTRGCIDEKTKTNNRRFPLLILLPLSGRRGHRRYDNRPSSILRVNPRNLQLVCGIGGITGPRCQGAAERCAKKATMTDPEDPNDLAIDRLCVRATTGAAKRKLEPSPIAHVAIRFRGVTFSLPAPARHHDVIRKIVEETGAATVDSPGEDQGFLDADGQYLTRYRALRVARRTGQLREGIPVYYGELCSENLW